MHPEIISLINSCLTLLFLLMILAWFINSWTFKLPPLFVCLHLRVIYVNAFCGHLLQQHFLLCLWISMKNSKEQSKQWTLSGEREGHRFLDFTRCDLHWLLDGGGQNDHRTLVNRNKTIDVYKRATWKCYPVLGVCIRYICCHPPLKIFISLKCNPI